MLVGRFSNGRETFYGAVLGDTVMRLKDPFTAPELGESYPAERLTTLAPVRPGKAVCVGLNYRDHARELNMPLPDEPILFLKPSTAVIGPGEAIVHPSQSERVDYEAELAVVIKKAARRVSVERAREYILGYTCANDVTARDLQQKDGQWTRAKSFDTFLPLGPYIATDVDPSNLSVSLYLNGTRRQHSNTNQLIFSVYELVSFISHIMTLEPGDVILTGTPAGVGPVKPGDTVEVVIEGIGRLTNRVIGEAGL
nr:fumarylacetoacetate hydrolase family protein [Desulfovirgula thermocuniculi]